MTMNQSFGAVPSGSNGTTAFPLSAFAPNQSNAFCGYGAADPVLRDNVLGLVPFRRSTGAFALTIAGDGSNIVLAAGSSTQLFAAGVGELLTAQGLWWTATHSDTDLKQGGAPEERDLMFYAIGFGFSAPDAFQRKGTGVATDVPFYTAWLTPDAYYPQTIAKIVLNRASIKLDFGSAPLSYQMGVPAMFPGWFGPRGDRAIVNGATQNAGQFLPLNAGVCLAGRDESRKMTMTLTIAQGAEIQNNAGAPTVVTGAASAGNVYQPIVCVAIGYPICAPVFGTCGIDQSMFNTLMRR